jgi:hypothetical protein
MPVLSKGGRLVSSNGPIIKNVTVPRNGLTGEWLFNGNANDTSGSGYNGTVSGATLTTDRFGKNNAAYLFNTGNYININVPRTDVLSISFWINDQNNYGTNSSMILFGSGMYTYYATQKKPLLYLAPSNYRYFNAIDIRNQWRHFVIVLAGYAQTDTLNAKMYIDGMLCVAAETLTTSTINSTHYTQFGTTFKGILDDIRFYNRQLDQHEVELLYNE